MLRRGNIIKEECAFDNIEDEDLIFEYIHKKFNKTKKEIPTSEKCLEYIDLNYDPIGSMSHEEKLENR